MLCGVSYGVLQGLRALLASCEPTCSFALSAIRACKANSALVISNSLLFGALNLAFQSFTVSSTELLLLLTIFHFPSRAGNSRFNCTQLYHRPNQW